MGIARFFGQSVIIERLRSAGGYKKSFSSTATVDGAIQALDKEARQLLGIVEEKAWKAWFPVDTILKENDILRDDTHGQKFKIREIVKKDYSYGINQHVEVILMEQSA